MISAPFAAAGRQLTRAWALPAAAVTLRGALGLPTRGFFGGGGGGGAGGGSPPSTSLAYLSTSRTWCLSSTTRAVAESGELMKRWFSRTSISSGPFALPLI